MRLDEFLAYAASDCVNAVHGPEPEPPPAKDRGTFQATCPRGHRIIPSTGEHNTWIEILPGAFVNVSGSCEELDAEKGD